MVESKKTLIVGLGVTGRALLDYFSSQKIGVLALEEMSQEVFNKVVIDYADLGHEFFFEEVPLSKFSEIDFIVTSPGIPMTRLWAQEAKKRDIPILGELEFASRLIQGELISVTGTNGKSTTVTLIQAILERAGVSSSLKGNIGSPLISAVSEPPKTCYVVEVSSYQLETIERYHSKIAVLLNVSADHLDRYEGIDEYAQAKANVLLNQQASDFFVYNADDIFCSRIAKVAPSRKLPFSLVNHVSEGAFIDRQEMVVRIDGKEFRYSLEAASLRGLHNQENMLASLLVAHAMGVSSEVCRAVINDFKGLAHRVELVHVKNGISFYDDSKGTNVGAVVMSLASFGGNVILILGGRDKGGDYSPLKPLIKGKVKQLILMGEAREVIRQSLSDLVPTVVVEDMHEAFEELKNNVRSGDVVLLSPACSSFDQYKNYAERGNHFKKLAQEYFL